MAFNLKDSEDDLDFASEINMTPFIDVMLVLLIIFMVAAPLATVEIPINLPVSTTQPQPKSEEPIYVTLSQSLVISVNERQVARQQVGAALDSVTFNNRDSRILLRADETVPYKELMALMDALREAGYVKVALVAREGSAGGEDGQ